MLNAMKSQYNKETLRKRTLNIEDTPTTQNKNKNTKHNVPKKTNK